MKIGQFVRRHVPAIFEHCENTDATEFSRLQDARYSKSTFDINYPFCKPVADIEDEESRRYWVKEYIVNGVVVRVTNHWFNMPTSDSLVRLKRYLFNRGLAK
ncbi:hypothetical protein [Roseivivax sp. CAU 1753]